MYGFDFDAYHNQLAEFNTWCDSVLERLQKLQTQLQCAHTFRVSGNKYICTKCDASFELGEE